MKCKKLTKFEVWYKRQHIVVHSHTAECGIPKTVNEMYVRIFTMLSVTRRLAAALFICESERSRPFRFALKSKEKVRASDVKAPRIFGLDTDE